MMTNHQYNRVNPRVKRSESCDDISDPIEIDTLLTNGGQGCGGCSGEASFCGLDVLMERKPERENVSQSW